MALLDRAGPASIEKSIIRVFATLGLLVLAIAAFGPEAGSTRKRSSLGDVDSSAKEVQDVQLRGHFSK